MSGVSLDLVTVHGDRAVTTSLIVADRFEKQHGHVLEAISKSQASDEFNRSNFRPGDYLDANGQRRPMMEITRDGAMFLIMGFTGAEAARWKERFIAAFNAAESRLSAPRDQGPRGAPRPGPALPDNTADWLAVIREARLLHGGAAGIALWNASPLPPLPRATATQTGPGQTGPGQTGAGAAGHALVRQFWQTVAALGRDKLNHKGASDPVIAVNLTQVYAEAARRQRPLPDRRALTKALRTSQRPRFLAAKTVYSVNRLFHGKRFHCWLFARTEAPGKQPVLLSFPERKGNPARRADAPARAALDVQAELDGLTGGRP